MRPSVSQRVGLADLQTSPPPVAPCRVACRCVKPMKEMKPKEDIVPRPDPQSGLRRGSEKYNLLMLEIKKQGGGRCRSAGQQQLLEKLRSRRMMKMKPEGQSAEGPAKKMKVAGQDVGIGRRRDIQAAAAGKF